MTSATGKGDFGKTHLNGMNFIKELGPGLKKPFSGAK